MSYQERPTPPGPARDVPAFDDSTPQGFPPGSPGREGPSQEPSAADRARDTAATGRDKAQAVAQTTTDQARDVVATAKGEARHVARTAQGQARRLADDTRHELRTQADTRLERVASGLGDLSGQLRAMGERGDPGPAADLAGEAAFRTQQFADRLRQGGFDGAVGSVRRFGRNRPGLFLLSAFGVGLVAGRVVRNLAQDPSESGGAGPSSAGNGSGSGYGYRPDELVGASNATPGATAGRYGDQAYGAGQPPPPRAGTARDTGADLVADTDADLAADASAQQAYGAPGPQATSAEPRTPRPGTAPVGEQRWGS